MDKKINNSLIITVAVFIIHAFSGFLEDKVVAKEPFAWVYLFLFYAAGLYLTMTLLEKYK